MKLSQVKKIVKEEVFRALKEYGNRTGGKAFGENGPPVYDEYDKEEMLKHYLVAALWSSTDESDESGGEPMDSNYDIEDITEEAKKSSMEDIDGFVNLAGSLLDHVDAEQAGHDFWLTRNGHGVGFWDRDYPEDAPEGIGDMLSDIAQSFGSADLYVGDDGQVHIM